MARISTLIIKTLYMWFHTWHIGITYKFPYKLSQYSVFPAVYHRTKSCSQSPLETLSACCCYAYHIQLDLHFHSSGSTFFGRVVHWIWFRSLPLIPLAATDPYGNAQDWPLVANTLIHKIFKRYVLYPTSSQFWSLIFLHDETKAILDYKIPELWVLQ